MQRRLMRLFVAGCGLWLVPGFGHAQAPGEVRLTALMGPAYRTNAASRPFNLGMSADASLFRVGRGSVRAGPLAEGGIFHPSISGAGNYYFSADAMVDFGEAVRATAAMWVRLFAVAGYTRVFNASSTAIDTADGVNFGVGADRRVGEDMGVRLEVRELYAPASDSHALVFRIGFIAFGSLQ
jgi:hypothetical protein